MNFATQCSGIEAASVAWNPLGWKAQFFSEIDKFPCHVLAHHYPHVPNHGDMTRFKDWPDATLDVLAAGTPCQSFSNAGLRAGLDDPRGQLMLTFGATVARYRPRWLVWENVPGVLSSNGGRDFGAFLGLLGFLGYGFAYRVLDAQYIRVDGYARAVPQRRQRVFVVGCLGDWRSAAAVLLERESLRGDPAPRRRSKEDLAARALCSSQGGVDREDRHTLILAFGGNNTSGPINVSTALLAQPGSGWRGDFESETFIAFDTTQITNPNNRSNPQPGGPCHTLAKGAHAPAIAFHGSQDPDISGDVTHPVGRNQGRETCVMTGGGYADAKETGPCDALRVLHEAVGEEAFCEWRAAVVASFQPAEVLRSEVHGGSVRREAKQTERGLDDGPLPRAPGLSAGAVSDVREAGRQRRAPQGRGLSEQRAHELDSALSKLPHEGAPPAWLLRDVWRAGQGPGLLQQALPAAQRGATVVRRLTPREAERLQGFPDDYTLIPWRGGEASDGPRYKALGNSWAVNCARWIGMRIQMVDQIKGAK